MLEERIAKFAPRTSKTISYRETGTGPTLILMHGIGSGSAGWLFQLETLKGYRLIAWDAPGYGASALLPMEKPRPADYAQALHEFLDRLLLKDVMLVASSLGCLMATAYAAAHPQRARGMILLGPAGGYAGDEARTEERLKQYDELGADGLAEKRAPTVVAKGSPPIALELSRWTQRRVTRDAYRRAVWCLGQGHLALDARKFQKKVLVACGTEDIITPEAGCKSAAGAFPRGEYLSLQGLGHVPHIEAPDQVNEIIRGRSPNPLGT
jgi:pimeloyl-ACP methyl ester carboxylesterase